MKKKVLAFLLALCLITAIFPCIALAQEEYTHIAKTTSQLKMRKTPAKNAVSIGSIPRGETVYIQQYGPEWCQILREGKTAYIMTQYLTDLTEVNSEEASEDTPQSEAPEESTPSAEQEPETDTGTPGSFSMNPNTFTAKFKASTIGAHPALAAPDEASKVIANFKIYTEMDIGEVVGDWCYIRCGDVYGYMLTKWLFKWDRYDAYAGDIPNLDIWPNLIWIKNYVSLKEADTGKVLQAVNADNDDTLMPGSAIAASEKDEFGRYMIPIERTYAYINEEDVAFVMPVQGWNTAESGDLISVMTTFFSVGIHTLQYRGRNWNIRLAANMINGTVLQPGQLYNQNDTIGPYSAATGYMKAPTTTGSGYGGGTCQINSTFYITSIQIPLLVYQRQVHQNVGMHYCKLGLDASVGSSASNTLRMENTLPYAITYHYFISDGVLTCGIFRD